MDPVTIFFIVASSIGIVSSGIGIGATTNAFSKIGIPPSSMPPPKRNTVVRVGVGLNNVVIPDHPLVDSEGPSPMIVAFDENNGYVGMSNWAKRGHINNGGYFDIEVFHLNEREFTQATNLQIIAQDGPICVAYILETWSDDTHRAWVGNQGPACGYEWGFSNIILGQNQPDFKPFCTWIDRAHTDGLYTAALQIHMEDFFSVDRSMKDLNDTAKFCKAPTMLFMDDTDYEMPHDFKFKYYPDFTDFVPKVWRAQYNAYIAPPALQSLTKLASALPTPTPAAKAVVKKDNQHSDEAPESSTRSRVRIPRAQQAQPRHKTEHQKRNDALANHSPRHVITTADPQHSARLACTSPGYRGPDIVSLHEGQFCDFQTKTLWSLCGRKDPQGKVLGDEEEDCYDAEQLSLVRGGKVHKRSYVRSEVWEMNGDVVVGGVVVNRPR